MIVLSTWVICRFHVNLPGCVHLGVSENSGTPKSSILIGFFIINQPFRGTPIFGNTHLLFVLACLFWA